MLRALALAALATKLPLLHAQTTAPTPSQTPAQPQPAPPTLDLKDLDFLLGSWSAQTQPQPQPQPQPQTQPNTQPATGPASPQASGTYTFRRDLAGHVLQRTSSTDHCTGPQSFDCQHHDQLTIFSDRAGPHGGGLYALYLDSEGHVIYYVVTLPDSTTVLFQSQSAPGAPHLRLIYHLEGTGPQAVLAGRFEGTAPGSDTYHPYLEWSGPRH